MTLAMVRLISNEFMVFMPQAKFGALGQLFDNLTELGKVFILLFYPFVIFFELVGVKDIQVSSS